MSVAATDPAALDEVPAPPRPAGPDSASCAAGRPARGC